MVWLSQEVLALLARQYGLLTRMQLRAEGIAAGTIDGWVAGGPLERVVRGVYRLRGAPVPVEQAFLAAVLRTGGLLTGEGLLALLGVQGCRTDCGPAVVTNVGRRLRPCSFRVWTWDVPVADRVVVARVIPAVRPELAAFDLAADDGVDDRRVRTVIDAASWRGLIDTRRLGSRARAVPEHAGAKRVAAMVKAGVFDVESEGERDLEAFLGPFASLFRPQVTGVVPGRRLDRFDDLSRLALEYDSREHHSRPEDRRADERRDAEARAHDVEVLRLRVEDIGGTVAPGTLARVLARRAERIAERATSRRAVPGRTRG